VLLRREGIYTTDLRPIPLAALQAGNAPQVDVIFTLCDLSASEECPQFLR
jgi:hypothetical protein